MTERFISVVVPVYNVEKYLKKCVNSILHQNYKNFEVVLVNDGSTDSSGAICNEMAKQDEKIHVIHKENGGLSDARNVGTKEARGEFITYVDSDDYVGENYLSELNFLIQKFNADMAAVGIETFYEGEQPAQSKSKKRICMSGEDALGSMLYQKYLDTSACGLLVTKEVALKNKFPYRRYHEDEFTTYKYYMDSKKVAISLNKQYFYLQRKGSIMHVFGQASMDELDAADNLVNICKRDSKANIKAAKSKKFSDYCQVLLSNKNLKEEYPEEYRRISQYLVKEKWGILTDSKTRNKNKGAAATLIFGVKSLILVDSVMNKARGKTYA